jgi:hypothetical protein
MLIVFNLKFVFLFKLREGFTTLREKIGTSAKNLRKAVRDRLANLRWTKWPSKKVQDSDEDRVAKTATPVTPPQNEVEDFKKRMSAQMGTSLPPLAQEEEDRLQEKWDAIMDKMTDQEEEPEVPPDLTGV